jgi:hypothetical protein
MKLEKITSIYLEALETLENLPNKTVDKDILGEAVYHSYTKMEGKSVPYVQVFVKKGLFSVDAPEGSTNFRATFVGKPYASFVYEGIQYAFINRGW